MICKMPWDDSPLGAFESWLIWFAKQSETTKMMSELMTTPSLQVLFSTFESCRPTKEIELQPTDKEELNDIIEQQFDVEYIPTDGPDSDIDAYGKYCSFCHAALHEGRKHDCPKIPKPQVSDDLDRIKKAHLEWRKMMQPEFEKIAAAHKISPETVTRRIG